MDYRVMRNTALVLGPLLAVVMIVVLPMLGLSSQASMTAGVTVLCAIWWIFEAIPIPATSLIPLALFPILGVLDAQQVAQSYGNSLVLLMLGGFILSTAMAHSGAHRHIALGMIALFGSGNYRRVVWGFMLTAALLSMWISNTATTLMLLPVALAVLQSTSQSDGLRLPLLLGICYAASLGGVGTPIGTPPNLIFMRVYSEMTGNSLSFVDWMRWGVPVVLVFLPLMAWYLTRRLDTGEAIEIPRQSDWTAAQIRVLCVFACTALVWVTRQEPFGGWSQWLGLSGANDAAVALLAVVIMFIVPDGKGGRLLDWDTANRIPWGMLLLFGGGIAIAKAFTVSGLATLLAGQLSGLSSLPVILVIFLICLSVTFLTEVTSNTATTALLMPVMAVAATAMAVDPVLLMVPAAISASCAFMLPVATAPNAIIFGSGQVQIREMVRAGFALNLMGAVIVTAVCYWSF